MNILIPCLIAVAASVSGLASAQIAPTKAASSTTAPVPLDLHASGTSGDKFTESRIRGKVAIVFYWSTGCAVCRDSLPELHKNLTGWHDKPFALVTVNVDKNANDWLGYERIQGQTRAQPKGLISLRLDEGTNTPVKLPLTLLVDAKGNVVARFEGRLAPEAWDGVADLMP